MFKKILPFVMATGALFAEGAAAPARENNLMQTLMLLGFGVLFFYFLLLRPEQKRRQNAEKQRNSMKKGDRVTAMGIIGTVVRVQDNSVILKMVDGSKIEVLKMAISDVQPGTEEMTEVQSAVENG